MDTDYCVECGEFRTDSGACGCGARYEELSEECARYRKVLEDIAGYTGTDIGFHGYKMINKAKEALK